VFVENARFADAVDNHRAEEETPGEGRKGAESDSESHPERHPEGLRRADLSSFSSSRRDEQP